MKIIILAGDTKSTRYIYNGISTQINLEAVLLTKNASAKTILKKRVYRLGLLHVVNQILFQVIVVRFLKLFSYQKVKKKIQELGLIDSFIPKKKIIHVGFVNSMKCIDIIKSINPDIIIVNGTAIIHKKVLECCSAIFINAHVGITPQYRGVHGGYWALRNRDVENFGVTIHKVDTGIDTGDIICQNTCSVSPKDNFLTYPLYQYALAIPLLIDVIMDIKNKKLKIINKDKRESKLYYHPTFTSYINGWLINGIK